MINLSIIYGNIASDGRHEHFLDSAEKAALETIPSLDPKGTYRPLSEYDKHRAFSHKGVKSVRRLASALFNTMMPSGVQWGKIDFPPAAWNALNSTPEGQQLAVQLRAVMDKRSQDIVESLNQKLSRSRGSRALRRVLVEGTGLGINKRSGLRFFPFRSFVVDRDEGEVRTIAIKEILPPDPMAEAGQPRTRYTVVRYPKIDPTTQLEIPDSKVGVWVQEGEDGTPQLQKDQSYKQYFAFVTEVPEEGHYAHSYVYEFIRLFAQVNHCARSLASALKIAGYARPIIKPGSLAAKDWKGFMRGTSGTPWVDYHDAFSWFESRIKLADWGFVAQLEDRWEFDIDEAFGGGIRNRPAASDASATAILQIVDEISEQIEDLHATLEDTFQRPLFMSEFELYEQISPLFAGIDFPTGIENLLKIEITTGTSVTSKQQAVMKFVQLLGLLQQLDPMRFQINSGPIADEFGATIASTETGDFYTWNLLPPAPPVEDGSDGVVGENGTLAPEGPGGNEGAFMTRGGPQRSDNPQPVNGSV